MDEVILGLPGPWADDNFEVADHYTTKIGGFPDWPFPDFTMRPDLLECAACKSSLGLLAQVYAPISTKSLTSEERVLYVFGCVKPECGSEPSSWRAVRVQKSFCSEELNLTGEEAAPLPSSPVSAPKDWQEDLWTFDSREDDDGSNDDIDLDELGRALSEAATVSSNTRRQNPEPETAGKILPVAHRTRSDDKFPVLPCFYTYTQEEKNSKKVASSCSKFNSVPINGNVTDLEDHTCEEKWEEESYEYDRALNADRTYLKFKKRMDAHPEQCFREELISSIKDDSCFTRKIIDYCHNKVILRDKNRICKPCSVRPLSISWIDFCLQRPFGSKGTQIYFRSLYSYTGKPLLATSEEGDCGNCSLCGAPRHYEMQLMPPLLYFLQEATSDQERISLDNWDWMTLIIYTCSKSCAQSTIHQDDSENQGWIVAEEVVIVQYE